MICPTYLYFAVDVECRVANEILAKLLSFGFQIYYLWMSLAEWLERLTANAAIAIVLGSIPATSDTVESEGRQMKQN